MAEVLTAAPIVAKVQAKSTSSILISFKAAVSSQALACIAGYKITFAYCRDGGAGACLAPSFIPPLSFCTPILPCTPRRAIPPVITPPSLNSRLLTSGPFPFGAFFQNGCIVCGPNAGQFLMRARNHEPPYDLLLPAPFRYGGGALDSGRCGATSAPSSAR